MGQFKKATKKQSKLRAAIFGPAGAGKTFTALAVAGGLGKKVAVIDTERGSASKYADRFGFDVCELEGRSIDHYVSAINDAGSNYDVLIIDSLTHAWQELLTEIDSLAKTKYRGNTWSAWSEGTPRQRSLVDAMLRSPCHIIATMRTKTEWKVGENSRGKTTIDRVGLAPEQGKGIEYEFDLLMEISTEHIGHVIKDRTGKFQDLLIDKPDAKFGKQMKAWLEDAEVDLVEYAKEAFDGEEVVSVVETAKVEKF
jgi:hypothetical protein